MDLVNQNELVAKKSENPGGQEAFWHNRDFKAESRLFQICYLCLKAAHELAPFQSNLLML